ncbi:sigma-70 family RNA polymerase sigma factor [Luteolibacter sp. SL250]|uniref:sigma-70 family RNA polymerase sigma factor n=1 Tax=Luteolibacter sp. SL250 TaxID=2995170 RepID=UPI00226E94D0|nr:sigma-70 family RNA polymerase sigma factor [Luteolibacter sp. SL250]WAC21229.1 sigma-70 family RNA polymerase sigma factor [Luteolibacter sp. SL250]
MPEINEYTDVVQAHHSGLRYFIRSLGVQSAWVDDLAQEAFLLAYRKWDDLDKAENAGAWLRTIARNLVMNELTKTSRRQRLIDENLTTLLLDTENEGRGPGAAEDHAIRNRALIECIDGLSTRSREIIRARYFDDRNSSQIGDDLNMQSATVRKVLFHSRQLLADCLRSKAIYDAH